MLSVTLCCQFHTNDFKLTSKETLTKFPLYFRTYLYKASRPSEKNLPSNLLLYVSISSGKWASNLCAEYFSIDVLLVNMII